MTENNHKVAGCTGHWIDIGTFADPWLEKCSECKATRQHRDEDDATAADAEPDHVEEQDMGFDASIWLIIIIFIALAIGIIAIS